MALTTVAKIRQRLHLESWEGDDTAMGQAITDADAMIQNYIGTLPAVGDADYNLASSISTDYAAFYTALISPEVFYELDPKTRKAKIDEIRGIADLNLKQLLTKPNTVLIALSTTG